MQTIHVVTPSGFECEIKYSKIDDFNFVRLLSRIEKRELTAYVETIDFLFNEEEKDRFFKACEVDGRTSTSKVFSLLLEVLQSTKEIKN